jgi:hypothetical protein
MEHTKMQLRVLNNVTGFVIYDGPSVLTGKSIIVIATGFKRVKNPKTGKMLQVWIMDKHTHPVEALWTGDDENVCGSCKHRHFRSCYVNVGQGPANVYKAWKRGTYLKATKKTLSLFQGKKIRLGAYGDPAAVPASIWKSICGVSAGWTAYTHAWKRQSAQEHKNFCMASCDTWDEAQEAMKRGWKPFYVRQPSDPLPERFFECPASKEEDRRLNCSECLACRGGELRDGQACVSIVRHGPSWKARLFDIGIKAYTQKKEYRSIGFTCSAA